MQVRLDVKRLREGAALPTYATSGAAGLDLHACLEEPMVLAPGCIERIPSGVAVAIPSGYVGLVRDRSGMALKGIHTLAGVIDSDYRGEILVAVHNAGRDEQTVRAGDRVAQMLVMPVAQAQVAEVYELQATERGDGGFGSTGR